MRAGEREFENQSECNHNAFSECNYIEGRGRLPSILHKYGTTYIDLSACNANVNACVSLTNNKMSHYKGSCLDHSVVILLDTLNLHPYVPICRLDT